MEYFLKVISLLEQFPCPDLVISMAETALAICPQDHKVMSGTAQSFASIKLCSLADFKSYKKLYKKIDWKWEKHNCQILLHDPERSH